MIRSARFLIASSVMTIWPLPLPAAPKPEALIAEGVSLQTRGDSAAALETWEKAANLLARKKDVTGEFAVRLRQVAACQTLGQQKIALAKLDRAEELAGEDPRRLAQYHGARGAVSLYARQAGDAEQLFQESARLARETKEWGLAGTATHNLGLLQSGQGDFAKARETLQSALTLARQAGDPVLAARTQKALADNACAALEWDEARKHAAALAEAAAQLVDSRDKAFLLMGAARVNQRVFHDGEGHDHPLRLGAFKLHQQAAEVAARIGDPVAQSYALGYQGGMYEFEKKLPEAQALTHRALALAQQAQAPDAVYRWQWQAARLQAKLGERTEAIEGYRRAVTTLQGIRNDVSIRHGNRNAGSSFREVVGGVFFELADLLLQRAEQTSDDAEKQKLYREARSTAELLKSAELEDYFQDDCVSLRRELTKSVENIDPKAAVLYIIPLADRTEILVSLPAEGPGKTGRIERFKSEPNDDTLTETVRNYRINVEDRTSYAYLEQSQQLYRWLIQPVEKLLTEHRFTTLVFVPDGALRTVPMAALHDGSKFLVEKYAVAVTPGLELMEVKKSSEVLSRMLVSGLTESVQGFSALPAVSSELERISQLFNTKNTLKDREFSRQAVSERLENEHYSIVHLATHGVFNSDVRKSFVLTHDNQLTLDDLERLIRPGQLRDQPLELLALSACETAAGDDRAALGLAGVAVKAGARSAFASLWAVNDKASASLVSDFYEVLKKGEGNKAQALQKAQCRLLKDPVYGHPCYWAPYLIIGNWM